MKLSFRWVRKSHLILATGLYWVGLAWLKLLEPVRIGWRLVHLPDAHGSIDAGFNNTLFHVTMREGTTVVWSGSVYLITILAWIFGPPLVAFLAWRSGRESTSSLAEESAPSNPALGSEPTQRILPTPPLPDSSVPPETRDPIAELRDQDRAR